MSTDTSSPYVVFHRIDITTSSHLQALPEIFMYIKLSRKYFGSLEKKIHKFSRVLKFW